MALLEGILTVLGPLGIKGGVGAADIPYLGLLVLFVVAGLAWARDARPGVGGRGPGVALAETLFFAVLVLYVFAFIYAANANMDYVQRFAASNGNVRLAPDTRTHRLAATSRYLPLLVVAAAVWVAQTARSGRRGLEKWAFPLALASGALMSLAYPSFLDPRGWGPLALGAYLPLFVVLGRLRRARGVLYGAAAWLVQTLLTSYWLGTYSLISLQLVAVLLGLEGLAFFALAVPLHGLVRARLPGAAFLVFPLAWTVFDWLRCVGFAGYPWILVGATQYTWLPLIQTAALTGVWGVGTLVLLPASAVASVLGARAGGEGRSRAARLAGPAVASVCLGAALLGGAIRLAAPREPAPATVRLALIQQNDDPRKNDYEATFETLRRLTDATLGASPDLVVWSETAFVPNIRRWSAEDPEVYPLAALVRRFLEYQRGSGVWLLTGNDDYELVRQGEEEARLDYNAAILFSPTGERVETYHKMRLVPFTESFPWKRELPRIHELLLSFDVYLWEPGKRRVIFEHPRFRFATPICFEDAFPDHVRRFVLEGLDVILNISNDYWSLTPVEARQHAANAVFRAVENQRSVVRATASGLTTSIDPWGRRLAELATYTEDTLVVEVEVGERRRTLYTRWGDWFPPFSAALLAVFGLTALLRRRSPAGPAPDPVSPGG